MMRWFRLFVLLLAGVPAAAETVAVRSGEHGDFTRLAFYLPRGADWSVGGDAEALRVTLDGRDVDFDTAELFDRIDRSRIGDVRTVDQNTLEIALTCTCGVRPFAFGSDMLVLDIGPVGARYPLPDRSARSASRIEPDLAEIRLGDDPGIGPRIDMTEPAIAFDLSRALAGAARPVPPLGQDIRDSVIRSMNAGMLNPAIQVAGTAGMAQDAPVAPMAAAAAKPSRLRTATEDGVRIGVARCTPDDQLLPRQDGPSPSGYPAAGLSEVFSELDTVQPAALGRRRDMLLSSALGAEARALDALAPHLASPVKTALSYLVDGEADPANLFASQIACEGQALLWAVLSPEDPTARPVIDTSAVLRHFDALPPPVRQSIGTRLADSLGRTGHPEAAQEMLMRLERGGGDRNELAIARASVALESGDADAAAQRIDSLLPDTQDDVPALALVRANAGFARGERVPDQTLDILGTFLEERWSAEDGPALWHGRIRALLTQGKYDDGVAAFLATPPLASDAEKDSARRDIVDRLVADAGAVTFLKVMVSDDMMALHPRDRLRIREVVERLIALGAPEAALAHLGRLPSEPAEADRLLQAEALTALMRPAEAETAVAGLNGPEADRIRARIREQLGDFAAAQAAYTRAGEPVLARRAAWLGGNWDMAGSADDAIAAVATLAADDMPAPPALPGLVTLESAGALLGSSTSAREALSALLGQTRID